MIERVLIQGYRKYKEIVFEPNPKTNILVGDNESGKSTLLEAMCMTLTGRSDGRTIQEELSPYWFNQQMVADFFAAREQNAATPLPIINIEIYFKDSDELVRLHGANNSKQPTYACPGLRLTIEPDPEYATEIEAYLTQGSSLLPVDYYKVEWKSFADDTLTSKPRDVSIAVIDSRTIRSKSGVDYYLKQMLSENLDASDKATASTAYRRVKEEMTSNHLTSVNTKMAELEGGLNDEKLSLSMDQSSRAAWETVVSPHIGNIPFTLSGLGQQAAVKTSLAMGRHSESTKIVFIEEPENHLSHTSLNKLLDRIESLSGDDQQLFITTHSSFVLNRLGFDFLHFVSNQSVTQITGVEPETVKYFKKLPGYDTLRMVLASKFVVVEGPSDEIMFERFYKDTYGKTPIKDGIDVISMRGLSLARCLELAKLLNKKCAAVRDNDGKERAEIESSLTNLLEHGQRQLFVGNPSQGKTLEPQIINTNDEQTLRTILGIRTTTDLLNWMVSDKNKTEGALRLAEASQTLTQPQYLSEAITFIHNA